MYIKLENKIIEINISNYNEIYIEKAYINCLDDDSKSGFTYLIKAKNRFYDNNEITIKQCKDQESAMKDLELIAEKLNAVCL